MVQSQKRKSPRLPWKPATESLSFGTFIAFHVSLGPTTKAPSASTTKAAAREQLARMTLVIRDYNHQHAKGEVEDEVESMVADIVDASYFVSGKQGTFAQPTFVNPLLFGREQEIAALMQEMSAQGMDDVIELWNVRSHTDERVLPEVVQAGEDLGAEIDWDRLLRRSVSENDIAFRVRKAENRG